MEAEAAADPAPPELNGAEAVVPLMSALAGSLVGVAVSTDTRVPEIAVRVAG